MGVLRAEQHYSAKCSGAYCRCRLHATWESLKASIEEAVSHAAPGVERWQFFSLSDLQHMTAQQYLQAEVRALVAVRGGNTLGGRSGKGYLGWPALLPSGCCPVYGGAVVTSVQPRSPPCKGAWLPSRAAGIWRANHYRHPRFSASGGNRSGSLTGDVSNGSHS